MPPASRFCGPHSGWDRLAVSRAKGSPRRASASQCGRLGDRISLPGSAGAALGRRRGSRARSRVHGASHAPMGHDGLAFDDHRALRVRGFCAYGRNANTDGTAISCARARCASRRRLAVYRNTRGPALDGQYQPRNKPMANESHEGSAVTAPRVARSNASYEWHLLDATAEHGTSARRLAQAGAARPTRPLPQVSFAPSWRRRIISTSVVRLSPKSIAARFLLPPVRSRAWVIIEF